MDLSVLAPAFLAGFASQCIRIERLPLYAPSAINTLGSFVHHRLTGRALLLLLRLRSSSHMTGLRICLLV